MIVRADMPVGLAAAQGAHAVAEFMLHHKRHLTDRWRKDPYLIILSAQDQEEIWALASKASISGVPYVMWCEPDMEHEATSLCLAPTQDARAITGHLPLFGREVAA